jgi:putative aldouronate transport system substrate-binding protein
MPAIWRKIPLAIASGDLADLQFCNAFNDVPLMMENELLLEMDELLANYGQNILAVTPQQAWDSTLYDGKQYAVAHNVYDLNIWCTQYRKDWLDKLGLAVPETLDEFGEVLRAFHTDDPDGNGSQDTWGRLLYQTIRFDDEFFHAFGVAVGHHMNGFWRQRGERLELDWVQQEMRDALAWMRDRWSEGVFHPDSISIPLGQGSNAFHASQVGNAYSSWTGLDFSQGKIWPSVPMGSHSPQKTVMSCTWFCLVTHSSPISSFSACVYSTHQPLSFSPLLVTSGTPSQIIWAAISG